MAPNEPSPRGGPPLRGLRHGYAGGDALRGRRGLLGVATYRPPCSATRRSHAVLLTRLVLLACPDSR